MERVRIKPIANGGNGGRDARGRFTKGNPGGPGCKAGAKVAELRYFVLDTLTEKELRKIIRRMIRDAIRGDRHARRELFDRGWGRPIQEIGAPEDDTYEKDERFL